MSDPAPDLAAGPPVEALSFDEALAELQATVARLEVGGLTLEAMLALHERGVALEEQCSRLLAHAQLRVQRLEERAGGVLKTVDVEPDPTDGGGPADRMVRQASPSGAFEEEDG